MRSGVGDEAKSQRALLALVCVAVLLVFGPGVTGAFVWDDQTLIVSNAWLRDLANLPTLLRSDFWHVSAGDETGVSLGRLYWRPVVTLAYLAQYQLFGLHPEGYHLVNIGLHLACSALVFGWLRRRLGPPDASRDLAAAAGALLFAVHPSRPESVAWISGCTDVWMTLWVLLAAAAFDSPRDRRGVAAGVFVALAIWSKEAAVLAPALFALDAWLVDGAPERRGKLPVVGVATAAALAVRLAMLPPHATGGTTGVAETIVRVLSTLGHYTAAVLWPWDPPVQMAIRTWDAAGHATYAPWSVALGVLMSVGVAALVALAARRRELRPYVADVAWCLAPLALVLNVVNLYIDVLAAMRLLYLPLVGVCALAARGLASASGKPGGRAASFAAVGLLAAMAVASIRHVGHFITEEDLWTHELAVNPDGPYACGELARLRQQQGRLGDAIGLYAQGVRGARRLGQRYQANDMVLKLATVVMLATPDEDQATLARMRDFFDAVDRGDPAPVRFEARGLRVALKWNDAERAARRAGLHYRMARAIAHARTLSLAGAEAQLLDVLRDTPDAWLAWQNLALVYATGDRWDDALRALDEALRRDPANGHARALRADFERRRAALATLPPGSPEREVALCEALAELHLSEAARRRLAALDRRAPGRADVARLRAALAPRR